MKIHMYEKVAKRAAKKAGRYLKKQFLQNKGSVHSHMTQKGYKQLVSMYDKEAEGIILKELSVFKNHAILSEEAGSNGNVSDWKWVIDPLDGTTNYLLHYPVFAVSIALMYQNEPLLGVIYLPMQDELFVAQKNEDAFLNGKPIFVAQKQKNDHLFITICEGDKTKEIDQTMKFRKEYEHFTFRSYGSVAFDLCQIACARLDVVFIHGIHIWDVCAGNIIAQQAGAYIGNFMKQPYTTDTSSYIVTLPTLAPFIYSAVKE